MVNHKSNPGWNAKLIQHSTKGRSRCQFQPKNSTWQRQCSPQRHPLVHLSSCQLEVIAGNTKVSWMAKVTVKCPRPLLDQKHST